MKKVIPYILLKDGAAFLADGTLIADPAVYCETCSNSGADELLFVDTSTDADAHHANVECLKRLAKKDLGVFTAGGVCNHIDDVKKYLYTGASHMFFASGSNPALFTECLNRFQADRVGKLLTSVEEAQLAYEQGFRIFYCLTAIGSQVLCQLAGKADVSVFCLAEEGMEVLKQGAAGLLYTVPETKAGNMMQYQMQFQEAGWETERFSPQFDWNDLTPNADGLLPVVVQDWETKDVLMVAYMNEEAYRMTICTGRMTYFSRSRQSLWIKGETSGHFQYVKSLKIDCDQDTLLAQVVQVGAACHTGNRSCFYRDVVSSKTAANRPYEVLEAVYATIQDRKLHPKEGSYTNYLFEKGLDKILKKVGEEAAEILIAAKNPQPEEVVYELGDFLYHVMVLMAEKGITWEDVAKELADRE